MSANAPKARRPRSRTLEKATPAVRLRVSDQVFESLARSILTGELKPNGPLPTQRDLARRFGSSALVVRQAIHRLEDLGLVRVRQGSTTIVLDPEQATDIRLIQLRMVLAPRGTGLRLAAVENQLLFVVPLLVLAERRITREQLGVLTYLLDSLPAEPTAEHSRRFLLEFWRQISKATGNPLLQQQVRWWSALAEKMASRGQDFRASNAPFRPDLFRKLVKTLSDREGSVETFMEAIGPLLDWMDKRRQERPESSA